MRVAFKPIGLLWTGCLKTGTTRSLTGSICDDDNLEISATAELQGESIY